MDKTKQLTLLTEEMIVKEKAAISYVDNMEYQQASDVFRELARLAQKAQELKSEIQKEEIRQDDVTELRSVQPPRKSVQNMLENEVAKTPKFEKLMNDEMGAKSAFEMRNSGNEWRNDGSKTAVVVNVQKRERPDNLSEIRKRKDIPRGTFINHDTGIEILFSKRSIEEIVAKGIQDDKRDIPVEARMAALYQMQDLIENAVCFDTQISEYDDVIAKNKSPNSLFIHKMHGVIDYSGEKYLANLSIEESFFTDKDDRFKGTSNRLYSLRDVKITPIEANRIFSPAVPNKNVGEDTSTSVTTITIPQLYDLVKTYDQSFFENPIAVGRFDREAEIKVHNDFAEAVKTFGRKLGGDTSELGSVKGADFYETVKRMLEWACKVQEKTEKEKTKSERNYDPSL